MLTKALISLARELEFTRQCAQIWGEGREMREARALELFLPGLFQGPMPGDRFAGRVDYPLVGFGAEVGPAWSIQAQLTPGFIHPKDDIPGMGFYCRFSFLKALKQLTDPEEIDEIVEFWEGKTSRERIRASVSMETNRLLPSDLFGSDSEIAFPLYRIAGIGLDYQKLLTLGIRGIIERAEHHPNRAWGKAVSAAYGTLLSIVDRYQTQFSDAEIVASLQRLSEGPPQSCRDAIQLIWLTSLAAGAWNHGRLDMALGPFLDSDIRSGRLDEASAQELVTSFWRHIPTYENRYNNRVTIGGSGGDETAGAMQFGRMALEATRSLGQNQPQLSLRFTGTIPQVWEGVALESISLGRTYPILYCDDVYIPATAAAFGIPLEEASDYLPFGCGETMIDHKSVSSPNATLNLPLCLLEALSDGEVLTLEELWSAYTRVVETHLFAVAEYQSSIYEVCAQDALFAIACPLIDDCEAQGAGLLDRNGARYLTAGVETYGNINASDSFAALEASGLPLSVVREALASNWNGFEDVHRRLVTAPKFGNDDDLADKWAVRVHEQVCKCAMSTGRRAANLLQQVVLVNNSMNVHFGSTTPATPDGRRDFTPFANANNPTSGNDCSGVTATLNSLVKLDPSLASGMVQNMKFSPEIAKNNRPLFEAILQGYFANGGSQAMITVVSRSDLEAAMRDPAAWGNLMVRVGGFSARFIDLPVEVQRDILNRTCHE